MVGRITENKVIIENTGLRDMIIQIPSVASLVKAGQIVHIKCGDAYLLRRPFSVAGFSSENIRICYDIRGGGTEWMAEQSAGTAIDVLGPVGNGYTVDKSKKHVLLVGGGTGIYSLLGLASQYKEAAEVLLGFRNEKLINSTADFEAFGAHVQTITDDKGFVTVLLEKALKSGSYDMVYICGPHAMMERAAKIAIENNVECEVSMEERMGCGIGACQACVCKIKSADGSTYKRVCVDGPVFNAKEIAW